MHDKRFYFLCIKWLCFKWFPKIILKFFWRKFGSKQDQNSKFLLRLCNIVSHNFVMNYYCLETSTISNTWDSSKHKHAKWVLCNLVHNWVKYPKCLGMCPQPNCDILANERVFETFYHCKIIYNHKQPHQIHKIVSATFIFNIFFIAISFSLCIMKNEKMKYFCLKEWFSESQKL